MITLPRDELKRALWAIESAAEILASSKNAESLIETLRARLSAPEDIYEEGCTPADFRVLRDANARMAQELFELRSKK